MSAHANDGDAIECGVGAPVAAPVAATLFEEFALDQTGHHDLLRRTLNSSLRDTQYVSRWLWIGGKLRGRDPTNGQAG